MALKQELPRLAAPLLFASAILVSFAAIPRTPPEELQPGEAPTPSAAEMQAAFARALGPGSPGIVVGSPAAKVTVLEFADFGCPYCARFALNTYPTLASQFVATGKVRWVFVPFLLGMFPNGDAAARAGQCAAEQGSAAFTRMHDQLYSQQQAWKATGDPDQVFGELAGRARLNRARFAACLSGAAAAQRTRTAGDLADRLGVGATPTFFINGQRVEGALPTEDFRAALTQAVEETR